MKLRIQSVLTYRKIKTKCLVDLDKNSLNPNTILQLFETGKIPQFQVFYLLSQVVDTPVNRTIVNEIERSGILEFTNFDSTIELLCAEFMRTVESD